MYEKCLECKKLGNPCDGPNFMAMGTAELIEWCNNRRKQIPGMTYDKIVEITINILNKTITVNNSIIVKTFLIFAFVKLLPVEYLSKIGSSLTFIILKSVPVTLTSKSP